MSLPARGAWIEIIFNRELRAYAVDEVRRTNGQISFDRALDQQRRFPDDPDDLFDV